jgi:hypothetical protein
MPGGQVVPLDYYHTIIYVRGYAMTQGEVDQTTADPFDGFNIGSTTYRAAVDGSRRPRKFIFESPVVRLATDHGYSDIFADGIDIVDEGWDRPIPRKSLVIHRYYEPASGLLGSGEVPHITEFAKGLSRLVHTVRHWVCANPANKVVPEDFRCYLLAHSMGGLVCRAFLQNGACDPHGVARCVDKFFTYATPHNGIQVGGISVPKFLGLNEVNTFNPANMSEFLDLGAVYRRHDRVDFIPEDRFASRRVFCMVGTNRSDYEAAMGLSRTFVGAGSDGLVRIDSASVWGVDGQGHPTASAATGYCYRSHSGWFGIVNSEESYQNLTRFLFGNVRVDVRLEVDEVRLPEELAGAAIVDALYQFEALASVRGARWFLTRRLAVEDSAAARTHRQLAERKQQNDYTIYLCSVFLDELQRVRPRVAQPGQQPKRDLAYRFEINVRVPDYEVDRRFWFDKHFEGGSLFQNAIIAEVTPPGGDGVGWQVRMGWETHSPLEAIDLAKAKRRPDGALEIEREFNSTADDKTDRSPGVKGRLVFTVSGWNTEWQAPPERLAAPVGMR